MSESAPVYNPGAVESKWQEIWAQMKVDEASDAPEDPRPRFYCLAMFPYPSGNLHMGHVRNYTLADAIARYKRMCGFNVLHPMGWDAFGLPAENAAIERGVAPARWTRSNIEHMRLQLMRLGFSYDWSREIATCDPDYYRWEQWLFLQLLERGLAYRAEADVNWCERCHTVLANEQVVENACWRCGTSVTRRKLSQWFIRITAYAEELLDDLDRLEGWPNKVVEMQRHWIGRSEGASIRFPLVETDGELMVFTTRPDTLMGATYLAVAPDHPLAEQRARFQPKLQAFLEDCKRIATKEADLATLEKRGMPLGIHARHPLTGEPLPVWAANFVLMGYGTGAVMCVPAHDQRDYEFARKYELPIKPVVRPLTGMPPADCAFEEEGILVDSGPYSGLSSNEAKERIIEDLSKKGLGEKQVQYRLRDWLVSRQRYWGAPIPVVHCENCGIVPVPASELPVLLPEDLRPSGGMSPLLQCPEFIQTSCPRCGRAARRETDTFDTFVESSWYMERFTCPNYKEGMLDPQRVKRWLPVDQYVGGIEHAVLHLLYARFFHKVLRDLGLSVGDEPFLRLLTQGMVLKDGAKMSKSKGNIVDPQTIIDRFGADTARLFILFAAPPEKDLEWSDAGVEGAHRFLHRVWRLVDYACKVEPVGSGQGDEDRRRRMRRATHACIRRVTDAFERGLAFNVAVASLMELSNELGAFQPWCKEDVAVLREGVQVLVTMLVPFVPHFASECHERLGLPGIAVNMPWPQVDENALVSETFDLVVQVNGKKRATVRVARDCDAEGAKRAALADEAVKRWVGDKPVIRAIYVPGRLLNLVVGK